MTAPATPLLARLVEATGDSLEVSARRWLDFLGPGTNELQIIGARDRFAPNLCAFPRTVDEAVSLLGDAERLSPAGVYLLINSPDEAVTTRLPSGRWHPTPKGSSTTDGDIRHRRALFIDVDAERVKGTSATDAELECALVAGEQVYDYLATLTGEASLAIGHSGNGAGVYVALDAIPETVELAATIRGIVSAVAHRFRDLDGAGIDTSVTDAKRLAPAFGTTKRKGAPGIDARPHRRTGVITPPAERLVRLSAAALENLLATIFEELDDAGQAAVDKAMGRKRAAPPPRTTAPAQPSKDKPKDAEEDPFGRAKLLPIRDVLSWLGLLNGEQPICPACGLEDQGVAIVQNGLKCSHARCSTKGHPGTPGFRTTIDCVAEKRSLTPIEAVRELADQFGFKVAKRQRPARAPRDGRERPDWYLDLTSTPRGELHRSAANVITVLARDEAWSRVLVFDEFGQTIRSTRPPAWDPIDCEKPVCGDWQDVDDVRLSSWLARHHDLHVATDTVRAAVDCVARQHVVNPVVDYLGGLRWDGQARIDTWLSTYLGVKDTPYARLVGRFFLISAVARAFRPGCKVDTMPILEGEQGAKKSTAVATLFGAGWTSDTPPDLASKDRFTAMRDRWCIEWGELDGMGKTDTDRLKGFLSSAVDDYRPSYGRSNVRVPRRSVFFGTVNRDAYLRDETGNRRFWPVQVGEIDIPALARDRDQIWAEACAAFHGGARWWPDGEERRLFAPQQAARVVGDPWLDKVREYGTGRDWVTVADLLGTALGIEPGRWTQADQNRVARCLTLLGWKRKQARLTTGARSWGYSRPDVTSVTAMDEETGDGEGEQ